MIDAPGYLYLNVADQWPAFALGPDVVIDGGALRLRAAGSGFVGAGAFLGGPVAIGGDEVPWFRVQALADALGPDEHVEVLTLTADAGVPLVNLPGDIPFPDPRWRPAPRDVADVLVPDGPARQLWIGGVLRGNGTTSPRVRQIRVEYGRDTAIRFLPATYGREPEARDRLERFLALNQSALESVERAMADLPRLLDPAAAPVIGFPSWLSWLSGWLSFDLVGRWSEAETRERLAQAFELYGARGTIEGLRRYLKIYARVEARITEPAANAVMWSLGETSTLGFTTRLAPAPAQGAVLDTTATLDESHLSRGDDFGAALFEDVAHRFCVEVYCADLRTPHALDDVRAVLDREKPAHTVYSLCVIAANMRVGAQARVGIDTIVAQGPPSAGIGVPLGTATLAAAATPCDTPREP